MVAAEKDEAEFAIDSRPPSPFEPAISKTSSEMVYSSKVPDDGINRAKLNGLGTRLSLNRENSKQMSSLWRDSVSTAISDRHGFEKLRDLCGTDAIYIPSETLVSSKVLGEGAYAVVSIAKFYGPKDPSDAPYCPIPNPIPQTVAVKALKADINKTESNVIDFVEEVRVMRKLRHKSIIEFIGVGAYDTSSPEAEWRSLFLVQEYMDSGTIKRLILQQMINVAKKLYSYADALRWTIQIAEGVSFLHNYRPMVIHRDLKCDNLMLTTEGNDPLNSVKSVKIADLGLHALIYKGSRTDSVNGTGHRSSLASRTMSLKPSKEYAKAGIAEDEEDDVARYEMTGETGAYCYMAPEVLLGQPYNEKVDVFSFGVIMYELFSRRLVASDFMNTNEWDESKGYAYRVASGFRPTLSARIPDEIKAVIDKCWAGHAELRPAMKDVVEKLKEIQNSGVVQLMDETASSNECCSVM